MGRTKGSKNSDATAIAPANAEVVTMDAANGIALGDGWYTIKQSAAYVYGEDNAATGEQKIRNSVKKRAEFNQPGAVKLVKIEGYDIQPLTFIARSALDAFKTAIASGSVGSRVGRVGPKGKRYIIRVPAEVEEAVRASLAPFDIALEIASAPKKSKKAASADASVASNGTTPSDTPVGSDAPPVDVLATSTAE